MLDSSIATLILDGLFAMGLTRDEDGISSIGKQVIFGGDLYLGLLTKLPNDNGAAYDDGSYFAEPSDPCYLRIKINTKSRINKQNFIAPSQVGEAIDVGEDKASPVYVINQGAIMYPEARENWDKVVGFGIFRSNDTSDTTTLPFLWGTVTAEGGEVGVPVEKEEVPIIRTGSFKVSLV